MTTPAVSQPVSNGTSSRISYMQVDILSVDDTTKTAMCRDQFGRTLPINYTIMRAKGNMPAAGERWVVDRQYGGWTFGAIMNGTTTGVQIPTASVFGLPQTLADTDQKITDNFFKRPTGTVEPTLLLTAPNGTLFLNGGFWYADLFNTTALTAWVKAKGLDVSGTFVLGTWTDGRPTITLPDFRFRYPMGANADSANGPVTPTGTVVGTNNLTLAAANLPTHTHTVDTVPNHQHLRTGVNGNTNTAGAHLGHWNGLSNNPGYQTIATPPGTPYISPPDLNTQGSSLHNHTVAPGDPSGGHTHVVNGGGSGTAFDNRPASVAINWMIWG